MASTTHQSGAIASETPLRVGSVNLPATGAGVISSNTVADTKITLNSVVVCWGLGAVDTTASTFSVDLLSAGVGFTVRANGQATAQKTVGYAVLRY